MSLHTLRLLLAGRTILMPYCLPAARLTRGSSLPMYLRNQAPNGRVSASCSTTSLPSTLPHQLQYSQTCLKSFNPCRCLLCIRKTL